MISKALLAALATFTLIASSSTASAADPTTPSFSPPGELVASSGKGRPADTKVYAPGMRFPIESGPAFANSQVWGHGGGSGPAGSAQCDEENFSYPWHDNYCESRSWDMPLCPSGQGHQGQDLRGGTCKKAVHWVVSGVDGTITQVGSYSVYVTGADGTRFDYLHMSDVAVKEGDKVTRGQRIGKVSNEFGGTPTTVHLHFNIKQNVAGIGSTFVPPYSSLVESYKAQLNPPPPGTTAPDQVTDIPEEEPAAPAKTPASAPLPEEPTFNPREDQGCSSASSSSGSSASTSLLLGAIVVAAVVGQRRQRRRR